MKFSRREEEIIYKGYQELITGVLNFMHKHVSSSCIFRWLIVLLVNCLSVKICPIRPKKAEMMMR
jgi:hypothetical protein